MCREANWLPLHLREIVREVRGLREYGRKQRWSLGHSSNSWVASGRNFAMFTRSCPSGSIKQDWSWWVNYCCHDLLCFVYCQTFHVHLNIIVYSSLFLSFKNAIVRRRELFMGRRPQLIVFMIRNWMIRCHFYFQVCVTVVQSYLLKGTWGLICHLHNTLYNIIILFVPKPAKVVKGRVYRTCWWKRKLEETMKLIKQFKACALCAYFSTGNVESYQKQPYLRKTGSFKTCDPCPSMPEGFVRFFRSMQTARKDALLSVWLIRALSFVCFVFCSTKRPVGGLEIEKYSKCIVHGCVLELTLFVEPWEMLLYSDLS